ncbi:peptide chain release factor N(5)-glutamine methyltransferase [Mycoplasma putrefaciens]|uniref:peptide chain release factor N(5)-glutamine methyltransferase n=1 Tax=Mycoplasma putrefaciens (strain ATCC 15718 / NCTC 10155 / C30 KS-1 / KS-1) TaxID=743965 RepID=A0A7U4E9Y3_MYCPK|nr:peptide chain release factor N(5)-glutamine methyltransferase [Mycoplasma putrefaciens]AEM69014.1 modification methylase, hemK family [Mycoplasma putrefaciens KS1]
MISIYKVFNKILNNKNISCSKADVYTILSHILKKDYQWIASNLDYNLSDHQLTQLEKILNLLETNYPLAYITKSKYFYKHNFYVDKNVLIPRIESEQIIDLVYDFVKNNNNLTITDLCTGSGCLGITLALLNSLNNVLLIDIDDNALNIARKNLKKFNLHNIRVLKSNFIKVLIDQSIKSNVLVCNPPYIDANDQTLSENVKLYEPNIALFASDRGLYFYKKLINNIDKIMDLDQNFIIVLEFGWNQKKIIEEILKDNCLKYNWEFKRDHYGNWRNLVIKNF